MKNALLLDELQRLAALVSLRPEVTLAEGDHHDCTWSFNWRDCHITVNPADLALRPADFSRGLVLHEAAHAGVTRLHHILPTPLLADRAVAQLLNCIEDCRIERWLQRRLPGCAPWIAIYNNHLFADLLQDPQGLMAGDPGGAFLSAILCRWWFGRDPANMPDVSREALDTVWPHIQRAIEACPPAECPDPETTRTAYAAHPVSVCYSRMDRDSDPDPMECRVRMTQHEMWTIVWRHILPVFRRLLTDTDSPLGKLSEMLVQMRGLIQVVPGEAPRPGASLEVKAIAPQLADAGHPQKARTAQQSQRDWSGGTFHPYHQALARLHPVIEGMTEILLRHLTAETRLRYRRHYPNGQKLDMRLAMQFEADPRLHDRLWLRQTLPTRPDPAFLILADASGSMRGERAAATFDALVILRETCLRLDIPLGIVLFADAAHVAQDWGDPDAAKALSHLCRLRSDPDGGTNMSDGLRKAGELLKQNPRRHRHLWLLSDGQPADEAETLSEIATLRPNLHSLSALGLGPDTESLAKLVPGARTNLRATQLPAIAARLFGAQVRAA